MSRTVHKPKGFGGMDPGVKDAQNVHARMDKRKLSGLTLDECLSHMDFDDYSAEILEEPTSILDLGNDKKYKRLANERFQYS